MTATFGKGKLYVAPLRPTLMTVRADEMEQFDVLDEGMQLQHKERLNPDPFIRWMVGPRPVGVPGYRLTVMEWQPDEMVKILRPPKWTELGVVDNAKFGVVDHLHESGLGT